MAIAVNTLRVERREDGTALITIDRPNGRNVMNHAFLHDLPATLAALDEDPRIRACVITCPGDALSAGGDIADPDNLAPTPAYLRQVRLALSAFDALKRCQTVTVGAVTGTAVGGGTDWALACDLTVASTSALFALGEEELDAEQALEIGLVQRVVSPEELIEAALELAGSGEAEPPLGEAAT